MQIKHFLFLSIGIVLIAYHIYVLYWTLKRNRKFDKADEAGELYVRSNAFHLLLFENLFRSNRKTNYKILKDKAGDDKQGENK